MPQLLWHVFKMWQTTVRCFKNTIISSVLLLVFLIVYACHAKLHSHFAFNVIWEKHERTFNKYQTCFVFHTRRRLKVKVLFCNEAYVARPRATNLFPNRQLCNRRLSNEKVIYSKQCLCWPAIRLRLILLSMLAEILAAFHSCYESYSCILMVSQSVAQNLGLFVNCLSSGNA